MSFDWGGFGAGLLQGVERGLIIGDKINEAVRKGRFKNSVDKANKDQETATAELNDERNRRAAAVADLEASKPGESLKETPEMAIPNMRFGESQAGVLQVPKQQTAIPVSSFSSFPEREMPQQTVRGAISPALADPQGAMSDDEYRRRSMAISRDKQRSYLDAQLAYYDNDPDKYMEIQKKRFQMDVNDDIKGRIERAMRGDGQAIGEMVNTLQKAGVFPQGEVKRNGDQVVLVDPKSGKTIWQGAITPDLIQQNAALYAMAENALANDEFDKVYQIGKDRRAEGREDQKLALEERKFGHTVANDDRNYKLQSDKFDYQKQKDAEDLNVKKIETNIHWFTAKAQNAYLQAKKAGQTSGVGLNQDFKFTADPENPESQVVQTKDGKLVGKVDPKSGLLIPSAPVTPDQMKLVEEAQKQGFKPTSVYDPISKRLEWGWVDPATGRFCSSAHPNKWVDNGQQGQLVDNFPQEMDNVAGATLYGGGQRVAMQPGGTPSNVATPTNDGREVTLLDGKSETPEAKTTAVESPKPSTPTAAVPEPSPSRKAVERPKYRNEEPVSKTSPATGFLSWLNNHGKVAYNDTSLYTDVQLRMINAANEAHGGQPLKAMDKYPHKEEGILDMARRRNTEGDKAARMADARMEMPEEGTKWSDYAKDRASVPAGEVVYSGQKSAAPTEKPKAMTPGGQPKAAKAQPATPKATAPKAEKPKAMTPGGKPKVATTVKPTAKAQPKRTPKRIEEPLPIPENGRVLSKPGDLMDKKDSAGGSEHGYTFESDHGEAVKATMDGKVIFKGNEKGYGPYIITESRDGSQRVYAHVDTKVRVGDWVRAGARFGNVDNNKGLYGKKNIFYYRVISAKELQEKQNAQKKYESGRKKKEVAIGLFD